MSHKDTNRASSNPNTYQDAKKGEGGAVRCQTLSFCSLFPVQKTTSSGIGPRVKQCFRVGNQYSECEKLEQPSSICQLIVVENT